jgi:hypothetical protein
MWSYVDQLNVSVLSDGRTLEDPHEQNRRGGTLRRKTDPSPEVVRFVDG